MKLNRFYFQNIKLEVNASSSFIRRTKCKYCVSGPSYYFYVRNKENFVNLKLYLNMQALQKKRMKRVNLSYSDHHMSNIKTATSFQHPVNYKGFRVKSHRKRHYNLSETIEILTCKCGKTCWAFSENTTYNIPEVSNKRSRYKTSITHKK